MGQRCIEAEILAQAIVNKTFKFIEKINDSNKDDEDFKNFSKKENQIKEGVKNANNKRQKILFH